MLQADSSPSRDSPAAARPPSSRRLPLPARPSVTPWRCSRSITPLPGTERPDRRHLVDCRRILKRGDVARRKSQVGGPDHAAHDLGVPRPRQLSHEVERIPAAAPSRVDGQPSAGLLRPARRTRLALPGSARRDDDALALDLVRDADRGCLLHAVVRNSRRFHLGRTDPLARDLECVVRAAANEPEPVLVDLGPVAMHPKPGIRDQYVSMYRVRDRARNRASSRPMAAG